MNINVSDDLKEGLAVYRLQAQAARNDDDTILNVLATVNNPSDRAIERLLKPYQGGGWYVMGTPQPIED